jgi:periplasmic divalent cation tolerance protein
MTKEQPIVVLCNVPDLPVAQMLAHLLVEQRIAACVNILPGVHSVYRWQSAIEEASEVSLLIKTTQARYSELESAIRQAHPYDVPEIIALPVVAGSAAYLGWIDQETKKEIDV